MKEARLLPSTVTASTRKAQRAWLSSRGRGATASRHRVQRNAANVSVDRRCPAARSLCATTHPGPGPPPPPRGRRSRVRGGRAAPHQRMRFLSITPCSGVPSFAALAPDGVEIDFEDGIALDRQGEPPADAIMARPSARPRPRPRFGVLVNRPPNSAIPVADLGLEAAPRVRRAAVGASARAFPRPRQPLRSARCRAERGGEQEREAPPALAGVEPRRRALAPPLLVVGVRVRHQDPRLRVEG